MKLSFRDIVFRTDQPDVPSAMPIALVEPLTAAERADTIRALATLFDIGEPIEVELPFGHALASELGQIEFFSASGAVRARNLALLNRFEDERREWPDVERSEGPEGLTYTIGERTRHMLIQQAHEILDQVRLGVDDSTADTDLVVGQWALLDDSGRERGSGPGPATVRLSYAVEGVPLIGPGAKTHLHFDPVDGSPTLRRFFHVLRRVTHVREISTDDTERAFQSLLADPFLQRQIERGGQVVVTAVRLGLLALPADRPQRFAFPTLQVDGVIEGLKDDRKGDFELRFGRYIPAVAPDAFRRAGVAISPLHPWAA